MSLSIVNSFSNIAYHIIHNGITQNNEIQNILMGGALAYTGQQLSMSEPAGLLFGAGAKIVWRVMSKLAQDIDYLWSYVMGTYPKGEYFLGEFGYSCFSITPDLVKCEHSYENDVRKRWGDSLSSFNPSDPRKKILFLGAHKDEGGVTSPDKKYTEDLFDYLNDKYDIRYKVLDNPLQVCHEMQRDELDGLVVYVHGSPKVMQLGNVRGRGGWKLFDPLITENCYHKLKPWAKIILLSCSAGSAEVTPNIAEWIALQSKRTVIAPTEDLDHRGVFFSEEEHSFSVEFKNVENMTSDRSPFDESPAPTPTDPLEKNLCHLSKRISGRDITGRYVPLVSNKSEGARLLPLLPSQTIFRGVTTAWGLAKAGALFTEWVGKGLSRLGSRVGLPGAHLVQGTGVILNQVLNFPFTPFLWTWKRFRGS